MKSVNSQFVTSADRAHGQMRELLSPQDREMFEACIARYELAWHAGGEPDPHLYVQEVTGPLKPRILAELQAIGQELSSRTLAAATVPGGPIGSTTALQTGDSLDQLHQSCPDLDAHSSYTDARYHTQGGLGEIWIADDRWLGRRVVIKRLKQRWRSDARAVRWFLQEAEIISRLEHPGIVPIHARGQTADGLPWYSMRWIEGVTLKQQLAGWHAPDLSENQRQAELRSLLTSFMAACRTVAYAHSRGIIHRDLKPENIMLGPFGETIVLDWGMAKRIDVRVSETRQESADFEATDTSGLALTAAGDLVGTPAYMAPEQANGDAGAIGPATDVFGLGAVLYAILTGHGPYHHSSITAALAQAAQAQFQPLEQAQPRAPRGLIAICHKALALLPAERYASPLELASDIDSFLADEPLQACRSTWLDTARRHVRKHQRLVAAGMALAIFLPLVGSVAAWQVSKQRAQTRAAESIAQARDAASRQVAEYLVKTFQTADPIAYDAPGFHGAGPRVAEATLRRMLENGNDLIKTHLLDKPDLRAQLLASIGNSYRGLAEFDKARQALSECLRLTIEHYPAGSAAVWEATFYVARLEHELGNYAEANQLYRQIIAGRQALMPPDPLAVADAQYHLAWLMFFQPMGIDLPQHDTAKVNEAVELFQQVVRTRREHLPPTDRAIGLALVGLAAAQTTTGHNPLAGADAAAEALALFDNSPNENMVGRVHAEYVRAEALRYAQRRYTEADEAYRKILDTFETHLGPTHPLVILHMWNMASLYETMEATDKCEAMITKIRELAGPIAAVRSCPAHLDSLIKYAQTLKAKGDQRAESVFQEAMQFARERPTQNANFILLLEHELKTP